MSVVSTSLSSSLDGALPLSPALPSASKLTPPLEHLAVYRKLSLLGRREETAKVLESPQVPLNLEEGVI